MSNIDLKYNVDSLRSLSQLFTPTSFSGIIRNNQFDIIDKKIDKHIVKQSRLSRDSLIKYIYQNLEKKYKTEYVYKNTLINKLLLGKYSLNTTTVINELKIGKSIADFVLLNGEIRIFEIKTELDSLQKVKKQIDDYKLFANKIYIVSTPRYIKSLVKTYATEKVGIIEYTNKKTLREIVPAQSDLSKLNHLILFKSLRKQEYIELIEDYFGYIPDVPNTLIFKECLSLASKIEVSVFQNLVLTQLKKRKIKCPDLLKSKETPYELKHLCYTLNFNEDEYHKLYKFLNKKI